MISFTQRFLVLVSFSFVLACGGKPAEAPVTPAPAPAATAPALAPAEAGGDHGHGAVAGSHEDWCGEHGVPESQCTRCNPKLIAAFKATNDWCAEHNLPESQCLLCHPDLKIVRPPKSTP